MDPATTLKYRLARIFHRESRRAFLHGQAPVAGAGEPGEGEKTGPRGTPPPYPHAAPGGVRVSSQRTCAAQPLGAALTTSPRKRWSTVANRSCSGKPLASRTYKRRT